MTNTNMTLAQCAAVGSRLSVAKGYAESVAFALGRLMDPSEARNYATWEHVVGENLTALSRLVHGGEGALQDGGE